MTPHTADGSAAFCRRYWRPCRYDLGQCEVPNSLIEQQASRKKLYPIAQDPSGLQAVDVVCSCRSSGIRQSTWRRLLGSHPGLCWQLEVKPCSRDGSALCQTMPAILFVGYCELLSRANPPAPGLDDCQSSLHSLVLLPNCPGQETSSEAGGTVQEHPPPTLRLQTAPRHHLLRSLPALLWRPLPRHHLRQQLRHRRQHQAHRP